MPSACAVDRRDDRLAHGGDEMRMARPDKLSHVGVRGGVDGGGADRAQTAHVGPRAERTPTSGDDDGPDVGICLGIVQTRVEHGGQTAAPAVHPLGPVECHHRHAGVADLVQHRLARSGRDGFRNAVRTTHPSGLLRRFELDVWTYCTPIGSAFRKRQGLTRRRVRAVDMRCRSGPFPRLATRPAGDASAGNPRWADRAPKPRT